MAAAQPVGLLLLLALVGNHLLLPLAPTLRSIQREVYKPWKGEFGEKQFRNFEEG